MAGNGCTDLTRPTDPRCPSTVPVATRMGMACPTCRSTPTTSPSTGTIPTPPTSSTTECGGTALCQCVTGTRRTPCSSTGRAAATLAPTETVRPSSCATRTHPVTSATTAWTTTAMGWWTWRTPAVTEMRCAARTTMTETDTSTRTPTVGTPMETGCPTAGRFRTVWTRHRRAAWMERPATPTEMD